MESLNLAHAHLLLNHLPTIGFGIGLAIYIAAYFGKSDLLKKAGRLGLTSYRVPHEYGGADVDDVLNLIPVLESVPRADTGSIGMIGASRGGMMTYLALTKTNRIAAAVVNSGLADLNVADRPEMVDVWSRMIPDYAKDPAAKLAARSAVHFAAALNKTTPILLLHGTSDWRAKPKTNAIDMAAALLEVKHPFRLVLFEGAQHGLAEFREEKDRMMRDWLDRYVKERKPWPSVEPHGP